MERKEKRRRKRKEERREGRWRLFNCECNLSPHWTFSFTLTSFLSTPDTPPGYKNEAHDRCVTYRMVMPFIPLHPKSEQKCPGEGI